MKLNKLVVAVWILIPWSCRSHMISTTANPDEEDFDIVKAVVHIVTSCYGDRIDAVGLAGSVPDELPRRLAENVIPVVMIDTIRSITDAVYTIEPDFRHSLQIFIVEAPSAIQLEDILKKRIRFSIWWNHMASFFIIDRTDGCLQTRQFLKKAWQSNILNAYVLCYDHHYGRVIATYNPFTSRAPPPWKRVNVMMGEYNHPIVVFFREYQENASICEKLDFEKTNDLGGYPITLDGHRMDVDVLKSLPPSAYEVESTNARIHDMFSRVLKANLLFTGHEFVMPSSFPVDMDRRPCALDGRVVSKCWTTYPHHQTGTVIISQFRGHKSQLNKILTVIDVNSRIGLGIVYLITLIFLKFFVRQALVPAFLNLVRITCDSGFSNLPHNTASRIFMTGLLFFVVTMQGIYQGNLAALLTQQIPIRQVNKMQDLVDFNYTLYGSHYLANAVDHPDLRERFVLADVDDCLSHVIYDSSAACLEWAYDVLDYARQFNLHISNKFVEVFPTAIQIRYDWPLQEQINVIIARIVEADIRETWYVKCNPTKLSDFQIDEEVKKNKAFKNIELRELSFAFVILGIGLLCATIAFIVEWAIQYKCVFDKRRNINRVVPI